MVKIAKQNKGHASKTWREWNTPENLKVLEGWARDGLTNAQIAKNIGISLSGLYKWKKEHVEFLEAFKKGKAVVDVELENALYKSAIGAVSKTTTYKMVKLDENVLKAKRARYAMNYRNDHPDASKEEATIAALEKVPTYERIAISEVEKHLPPNTGALMFLLKNRLPEKYREKTYQELNEAQAEKAKAEAEIAKKQLEMLNQSEAPTNDQLNSILDKLAKDVTEENDSSGSTDQETKPGT